MKNIVQDDCTVVLIESRKLNELDKNNWLELYLIISKKPDDDLYLIFSFHCTVTLFEGYIYLRRVFIWKLHLCT